MTTPNPTPESEPKPNPAPPAAKPASPAAPAAAAAAPARKLPRRSSLVTWLMVTFGVFQGLAILKALIDLAWPHGLIDFPGITIGFSCLQNFAVIPLVLAVAVWMLTKSYGYHPWANRLAKAVVAHFLLSLVCMILAAVGLILALSATVPDMWQSQDPLGAMRQALARMIDDHLLIFRAIELVVLLFELLFMAILLMARKAMRNGHFAARMPAAAAAVTVSAKPATPSKPATPTAPTAQDGGSPRSPTGE